MRALAFLWRGGAACMNCHEVWEREVGLGLRRQANGEGREDIQLSPQS